MRDELAGPGTQQCPACQQMLRNDARFCARCGYAITASMPPPMRIVATPSVARFAFHLKEIKRVGWLFGLLLFSSFLLGTIDRNGTSPWPAAFTSVVDALIVLLFVGIRYRDIQPLLRLPHLNARAALGLFGVALVFVTGMSIYFALIKHLGVPMLRTTDIYQKSGWPVWSMFVLISVMPAVFEELAFRGVIQSTLEHVFDKREAWLIQAALFSVLHLLPMAFPSHFLMGLSFGCLRLRSKSLYPGMVLHATWNALVLYQELYWF